MNFFDFNSSFTLADFFAKVDTGSLLYASLLIGAIVAMVCAVVLAVITVMYLVIKLRVVANRFRDWIAFRARRYRPTANLFFKRGGALFE